MVDRGLHHPRDLRRTLLEQVAANVDSRTRPPLENHLEEDHLKENEARGARVPLHNPPEGRAVGVGMLEDNRLRMSILELAAF